MKHLEFNLRMPGFLALETATRQAIMDQESVEQMPADQAAKMLERVGWAQQYIVMAKFQEAGVFITAEWSVLIMGQSHLHCVSVLCGLLKLIEEVLDTHVSITLVTVLDKPASPLYGYLVQQARLLTLRQWAIGAALILIGAFAGAAVNNWIWPLLPGG
ncbi:MAG: hypothetical protein OXL37_06945 [Chloroflexota bacterium]|nr:hypothetical protein [Chloroflexota bacterium]MDE2960633.1 hypothetical protein [Chloroflexota bacterium]